MNDKLKKSLEALQDELKRIGPDHPHLHALQQKTAQALEAGEHLPLVEEIRESAGEFEVRHPQLTELLNNVMNSLSSLGI